MFFPHCFYIDRYGWTILEIFKTYFYGSEKIVYYFYEHSGRKSWNHFFSLKNTRTEFEQHSRFNISWKC